MADKTPSYKGLQPASEASSRAKRANKRRDTIHEVLLRSMLWRMGLRFRKNVTELPGKPDIVFPSVRVTVFCDGDFWHGRNWEELQGKLAQGTNSGYWVAKIKTNRNRDQRINSLLEAQGWHVVRVWETDVKEDPVAVATKIKAIVDSRRERRS
jgi:DNA mismatch endonuclease, patch repair protein